MAKAIAEQKDKAMTLAARVKPDGLFYALKGSQKKRLMNIFRLWY